MDSINEMQHGQRLPKESVLHLIRRMFCVLKASSTVVSINVPKGGHITICGDVHGQFQDMMKIFTLNGLPSETNPYLFNGDFVDRGSFSVEVILTLFSLKAAFPHHVHLARGNHETRSINSRNGFLHELSQKYGTDLYSLFCEVFCLLPVCHVINDAVFVVHGGLCSRDVTLEELQNIDRTCEPVKGSLLEELLWSDPHMHKGRKPSARGAGVNFGPDITERFLEINKLSMIIRSHEFKQKGYDIQHRGKLITVFSAPNYCGKRNNKGAYIKLDDQMKPDYCTFDAAPRSSLALKI